MITSFMLHYDFVNAERSGAADRPRTSLGLGGARPDARLALARITSLNRSRLLARRILPLNSSGGLAHCEFVSSPRARGPLIFQQKMRAVRRAKKRSSGAKNDLLTNELH